MNRPHRFFCECLFKGTPGDGSSNVVPKREKIINRIKDIEKEDSQSKTGVETKAASGQFGGSFRTELHSKNLLSQLGGNLTECKNDPEFYRRIQTHGDYSGRETPLYFA